MKLSFFVILSTLCFSLSFGKETIFHRIAFGSCFKPDHGGKIWKVIQNTQPNRLVLLGDTMYSDHLSIQNLKFLPGSPEEIQNEYNRVRSNPYFQNLVDSLEGWNAIFDDHDYGINNGDKYYEFRNSSQSLFWDFTSTPADSPKRKQSGVYSSMSINVKEFNYKLILLDTRSNKDKTGTSRGDFLGEEQWTWLEDELDFSERNLFLKGVKKPDVVLLGSSIQVLPNDKSIEETWSEFPQARERLLGLVSRVRSGTGTGSDGVEVVLLSGDIHSAEALQAQCQVTPSPNINSPQSSFLLNEFTSSGLSHSTTLASLDHDDQPSLPVENKVRSHLLSLIVNLYQTAAPNSFLLHPREDVYNGINFGLVEFVQTHGEESSSPTSSSSLSLEVFLRVKIMNHLGETMLQRDVPLSPSSPLTITSNPLINSNRLQEEDVDHPSLLICTPIRGVPSLWRKLLFRAIMTLVPFTLLGIPFLILLWILVMGGLYIFYRNENTRREKIEENYQKYKKND